MKCTDTPRMSTIFKTISVLRRGGNGRGQQTEACRSMSHNEKIRVTQTKTAGKQRGGWEVTDHVSLIPAQLIYFGGKIHLLGFCSTAISLQHPSETNTKHPWKLQRHRHTLPPPIVTDILPTQPPHTHTHTKRLRKLLADVDPMWMKYLTFLFLIRTISVDVFLIKPLMEIDSSQRRSSAADAEALLKALPCQSFSCRLIMIPPTPVHLSGASGLGITAGAKEKI